MNFTPQQRILINADGTTVGGTILPNTFLSKPVIDNYQYVIDTGTSLSGSAVIALDGSITPSAGMTIKSRYNGRIATPGANTVTYMGKTLTPAQANSTLILTATYTLSNETANANSWVVQIEYFTPNSSNFVSGTTELPIVLAGQTKTLVVGKDTTVQILNWTGTLTGSNSITATALADGDTFIYKYTGSVTLGAYAISFHGVLSLTAAQAQQQLTITAVWDATGSVWNVTAVEGIISQSLDNIGVKKTTLTSSLSDITLTAGVNKQTQYLTTTGTTMGRSFAITANNPTGEATFLIKISGSVILGTYTFTIFNQSFNAAQLLGGDITVWAVWDSVNSAWVVSYIANMGSNYYETKVSYTTTQILAAGTQIAFIPPASASQWIELIKASWYISYNSAAYATHTEIDLITDTATCPQFSDLKCLLSTVSRGGSFNGINITDATMTQLIIGKGIYLKVPGGNPVTGDSGITVYATYKIVTP